VKRLADFNTNARVIRGYRKTGLLLLCVAVLAICKGCRSTTAPIRNGDLAHGGDAPDYWQSNPGLPGTSILRWNHTGSGPAELEIDNIKPNDCHWTQIVHLNLGWYLFTAEVRAEGVPNEHAGANLSSLEDGIISTPISGTTDWKTLGFYLKVGQAGADLPIACRLGGYSSPNTGKAFFRNIAGAKVDSPSQENIPRYDLDTIRGIGVTPPKTASAPNPTRVPRAQASITAPTEIIINEGEHNYAARPSKRNVLIEHSIDFVESSMAILLVVATLYAGSRVLSKKPRAVDKAPHNDTVVGRDTRNSSDSGPSVEEGPTEKDDRGAPS
jgi:hypothetical protein